MSRDHALIDELLAVRALDGLDEDDAALLERELGAHGDCDDCRRLEVQHAEVAGMLAQALDPRPVDPAMADRIVAEPQLARERPGAAIAGDATHRDARLRRWQAAFGVAAAIALVLGIALGTRSADVAVPDTIVRFEGASGSLAMAYAPGERGAIVWGADLPDPGEGRVYELWTIEGDEPSSRGCFTPTAGAATAFVDADVSSADLVAVTVESTSCPDAPTTDPVFTAELR